MVKAPTPKFRRTKRGNDFEKGQLYLFLAASYNVVVASRDTGVENKNGEKLDDVNDEGDVPEDNDGAESKCPSEDTPALGIEGINGGISDDESDGDDHEEDDVSEDDDGDDDYDEESKEYPDEEMPKAKSGSDENSSKEVNLIDGHYCRIKEEETFELQLEGRDLIKNDKEWGCRCVFPRLEDDILLFLTLMGDYEDTTAPLGSAHRHQPPLSSNKRSPLDRPFWKTLRGVLDQNGTTTRNTGQDTNDGMDLESLAVGAVILASHQGGFYGVKFEIFFGRLLYELGVRGFNEPVAIPDNAEMENFAIPFLSPPNVAWPDEFVAFWKNTRAQFANMERSRNGKRIDFTTHSDLLTGECKVRKKNSL
ncbi:hypothetical protein DVH05_017148 [Phytophthora capsici]|nr:hypothetical protein DVH05_017148 [Phytophthora capsici]